jgi:hypothetical protein
MAEYPNWFSDGVAIQLFAHGLGEFQDKPVNFLQIGAYTGDASRWLVDHVLTHPESTLTDVDTWQGSDEQAHHQLDWSDVEEVYTRRVANEIESGKVRKIKSTSAEYFANHDDMYDFIYVDGDHTGIGVLADGMDAYDCLNVGGILAFDDYGWNPDNLPSHLTPAPAIDAIVSLYVGKLQTIHAGYQFWFRKIS